MENAQNDYTRDERQRSRFSEADSVSHGLAISSSQRRELSSDSTHFAPDSGRKKEMRRFTRAEPFSGDDKTV